MRVAYLIPDSRPLTLEELQAWNYLRKAVATKARKITFERVAADPSLLASYDVIWWHCDGGYPDNEQISAPLVQAIKTSVSHGRGLLLSLLACQFVTDIGLETVSPNVVVRGEWTERSWAEGYPDIRGFGGFSPHPVFSGFLGGLYTWTPKAGDSYSSCYYDNALPSIGKIVAVEKLYITLNEQRRIMVEYELGKGRILTIGSHFYFSDSTQRFRAHLEKFANNSLRYVAESKKHSKLRFSRQQTFWNFDPRRVSSFEQSSKKMGRVSVALPAASSDLAIHRETSADADGGQFFDIAGRRFLMMGRERGGITEIWSHPTRLFKNIRMGIKVGELGWHWSDELNPTITIRPESLTRRYECDGAVIEEVLYASLKSPAGVLHFEVTSKESVQIVVSAQMDLRLMWPLSEEATGSLKYAWDPGNRSAVVTDSIGKNAAVFGSSCPPAERIVGQFSAIRFEADHWVGIPSDEIQVLSAIRITLTPKSRQSAFVFAGSGVSLREAVASYRLAMKRIPKLFEEQVRHFKRLLGTTLQLTTPDEEFNKSYRWSVVGTDKLFAETPGLGSSFLAGYGFSSSGWDGGQKVSGRPGYAWYFGRDSAWTCLAVLDCGDFNKVRAVLEFLGTHQDISGKILHEMTTSGHAHFDAADSTPLYLVLFGRYLRASGDVEFVKKELPNIRLALAYCYSTDADGDHLIENTIAGHGWIEGGKLFPSHTEHYLASCWAQALTETAYIAEAVKDGRLMSRCMRESNMVRSILRTSFRNDETGFYNFAKNRDGSFRSEKTILPTVGMYFDCSENNFSQRSLSDYASDRFSSDWGVRLISKDDPLFDPVGYHYGSIWPLFTGWTALAEFRMHRPIQGFNHLMSNAMLFDQFSAGCTEEVLHGTRFQSAGVCPHQAWSGTMILQPALEGLLGLKRDARSNSIELRPYLPPHWEKIEAKNIRLGNRTVTMKMRRDAGETVFTFSMGALPQGKYSHPVRLILHPIFPLGTRLRGMWIDGIQKQKGRFLFKDKSSLVVNALLKTRLEVHFEHSEGVSVVPPHPHLVRGKESTGLRIVNEGWNHDAYVLTLDGKAGEEYLIDIFDPSGVVKHIDGAVGLARVGEVLTISARFAESSYNGYVRKEISLSS
jgi:glycogen debranching enzyme